MNLPGLTEKLAAPQPSEFDEKLPESSPGSENVPDEQPYPEPSAKKLPQASFPPGQSQVCRPRIDRYEMHWRVNFCCTRMLNGHCMAPELFVTSHFCNCKGVNTVTGLFCLSRNPELWQCLELSACVGHSRGRDSRHKERGWSSGFLWRLRIWGCREVCREEYREGQIY